MRGALRLPPSFQAFLSQTQTHTHTHTQNTQREMGGRSEGITGLSTCLLARCIHKTITSTPPAWRAACCALAALSEKATRQRAREVAVSFGTKKGEREETWTGVQVSVSCDAKCGQKVLTNRHPWVTSHTRPRRQRAPAPAPSCSLLTGSLLTAQPKPSRKDKLSAS